MKYLGSKNRISKHILPIMLEYKTSEMCWVEPFVGGANMIDKVEGHRIGSDSNEYVIALLNEMSKPDFDAPKVDETLFNDIKKNKDKYEKWLVGYVGTQLTFGSTWFGTFRRDKQGKRDYCLEARNNVNKQSKNIQGVNFLNYSYDELPINSDKSLIYCDPPYNTKATKGKYKNEFNHSEFWEWCRDMSNKGHVVFVSEYNAPNDFKCIWEKEINQRMNNNVNTSKSIEKLFIAP